MAQKYKCRLDWGRKEIKKELCLGLKFAHTYKWYMHKTESCLENKTHEVLWNFEIKTNQPILTESRNLILVNKTKRNGQLVDFIGNEKLNEYMYLAWELENILWHWRSAEVLEPNKKEQQEMARILTSVHDIWGLAVKFRWKPPVIEGV